MKHLTHKKSSHGWWMMSGCAVMFIAGVTLFIINGGLTWGVLMLLLCPLMHLFIHRDMHSGSGEHEEDPAIELSTRKNEDERSPGTKGCH